MPSQIPNPKGCAAQGLAELCAIAKGEHQEPALPSSPGTGLLAEGSTHPLLILAPAEQLELPPPHHETVQEKKGSRRKAREEDVRSIA